jgi:hypothetical protein
MDRGNFFQEYIRTIEMSSQVRQWNHVDMLNVWSISGDTIQYFHPHHVANRDRLKNGFKRALDEMH